MTSLSHKLLEAHEALMLNEWRRHNPNLCADIFPRTMESPMALTREFVQWSVYQHRLETEGGS